MINEETGKTFIKKFVEIGIRIGNNEISRKMTVSDVKDGLLFGKFYDAVQIYDLISILWIREYNPVKNGDKHA